MKQLHSLRFLTPLRGLLVVLAAIVSQPSGAAADFEPNAILGPWRLLDYIAVDYAGAVRDGQVLSAEEYVEMNEFAREVRTRLARIPESTATPGLLAGADSLSQAIAAKQAPDLVATLARQLCRDLLAAYPVEHAPKSAPDLARGAAIYEAQCASCHGASGHGDGAAAAGMSPPPVDFHDRARQRERSLLALHGTITNGVSGTAMPAFAQLDEASGWALAFYVGQMIYGDADRDRGRELVQDDARVPSLVPDLAALVRLSPAQMEASLGEADGRAVSAWLRAHPETFTPAHSVALGQVKALVQQAAQAYAAGDSARARDFALSAYVDHFEPLEPAVAARDSKLKREIESAMIELRAALQAHELAPAEIQHKADAVDALLTRAAAALDNPQADAGGAFASSFIILFREGLEAMLVLVAMVAFLRKAGRSDALRYVNIGWIAGLLLGLVTWVAATFLITISGAQRELTEAYTGLLAVTILIFVGLWMHGQSLSGRWQQYLKERIQTELSSGRLWGLALLAFIAVYREAFETVLFYRALWEQGAHGAILAGLVTAGALLAAAGWALFRAGVRLPLTQFFRASAWLIAVLAVVLAGKAVAAFQEAGSLGITPVHAPQIGWLGVFPTAQGIGAQGLVIAIVLGGIAWNTWRQHTLAVADRA